MELLNDFNTSVRKAFDEIDPNWESYDGLVICGTHAPVGWEAQIEKLKDARLNGRATLGICFGLQLMAIEYARNILGKEKATSEELEEEGDFVVRKLPELRVGLHNGESYWNNYGLLPGLEYTMSRDIFSSKPFYEGVQYHPEYQSSKENPHIILKTFLEICKTGNVDGRQA